MERQTPAYWPTRIMLAVGVVATAAIALLAWVMVSNATDCFGCESSEVLGVPSYLVGAGVGLALVGLAWMVRIFRGPRDEPPAWRHRDR